MYLGLTREAALESFDAIMGHYLCPRCGGKDSFVGNVLVERRGVTLTTQIQDSGVYGSASSGKVHAVQAVKCRNCSEVLSDANYVPSETERRISKRVEKETNHWAALVLGLIGLAGISSCLRVVFDW